VEERPFEGRVQDGVEDPGFSPGELHNDTLQPILELVIHPRKLLPQMPCVTADEPTTARIRAGRTVNLPDVSRARQVKVFVGQRDLIAIATRVAGTLFHAKIVLSGS
jgi:tRNA pseudouridine55 synthase